MTTPPQFDRGTDRQTDHAILFDMDGVILEGRGSDPIVHSHALEDVIDDLDLDLDQEHLDTLERYEYTAAFEAACETIGIDPVSFYKRREEYSATHIIDRIRAGKRELYPDVDAIESLQERCLTGLVSNNYDPAVSFVVNHFELDTFSFVRGRDLGVEGFRRRKPEPYYLQEALETLDVSDGWYVGDRETDLVAAERAGLRPVFVRRAHNATVEPDLEAYTEVQSLSELTDLV
ncbi:HAD family hydrolase [Natronorubrum thiooxidans]|uniref:Haloacid dehalogenase superfamily, subfamily IA, variant 1 with third motif having Dx(3-4)D or Dx(3-4)E n=1 Tax=Natronorubrum thiooxidans TaxID=308853 RepID=A0A1N7GKV1_9EURY|nr:HAD family hydrolase [Natronorubrum thiooxidans]SIS13159.1 haloacid dehalogenase superfamily, subfamily IA, variant 1 with third motif having Dx(3-4)D or Dx(3-4)E [Natronorubrum thiooxidans]